jgi:CBS domain containing-hemolysin-like protein
MLSAFFSGSEAAFLNLKKSDRNKNNNFNSIISNQKYLLIGLLSGNTIINITIAFFGASLIHYLTDIFDMSNMMISFIEIAFLSLFLLIFGEIIPKVFAMRNSLKFAQNVSLILKVILFILKPIILLINKITNIIENLFSVKDEKIFDSEEELKILTELGEQEGTLEEEESEMIQSIIDFNDKYTGEILTPRVDIIGIEASSKLDDVMDLISKEQFSKIPIFVDNIDNIKGIIHAKDVTPYLTGSRPNINLLSIARTPYFVPETKPIDELLKDFKNKKTNIAIVVDEWGGTEGLITLEDIVEEVLGEIRDPFDNEKNLINKIKMNSYMVDAKISIYDLQEAIDIQFPDGRDYDTLGGFILDQVKDIPKKNDIIKFNNITFCVKTISNNRIGKINIIKS